jgi:hypothetical protein
VSYLEGNISITAHSSVLSYAKTYGRHENKNIASQWTQREEVEYLRKGINEGITEN